MGTGAALSLPAGIWGRPDVTSALDRRDIGNLLELIRAACHLTQHRLAAQVAISQTQISQWINGIHKPTLDSIRKIADASGMPAAARTRLGLSTSADPGQADLTSEVRIHRVLALAEYIGRTGDTSQLDFWRDLTRPDSDAETWERLSHVIAAGDPTPGPAAERMAVRTSGLYRVVAKLPARTVTQALSWHARDITSLFDAVENPEQRRQLRVTGGE